MSVPGRDGGQSSLVSLCGQDDVKLRNPCFWFPQFKGYFKTTAPQDTDYVGLLDDDLLDQAPSEPIEISLPKSHDGKLWPKIGHPLLLWTCVCNAGIFGLFPLLFFTFVL